MTRFKPEIPQWKSCEYPDRMVVGAIWDNGSIVRVIYRDVNGHDSFGGKVIK